MAGFNDPAGCIMTAKSYPALRLTVRPSTISRLATLLQRGFLVPCPEPVALNTLLQGLPGFDQGYIRGRIETIFINGRAADALDTPLQPGCTVALSAAMPGLAGAIFRKGGAHASLRSIPAADQHPQTTTEGFVTVKLFNMIATDRAEDILPRGILMKGPVLARFLRRQQERLRPLVVDIRQDTHTLSLEEACLLAETTPYIKFKATETSEPG